eukprot:TRINITY_DN25304_c0_g1_i2.p1 TRINITY_DN25304_c0_g1~~TRINITY_DN25304_c0_g1_i2.p1  ORF type:complete len:287 (+),score=44.32 TRINITY_DN25304_c0_g1_i2:62-862(+)
MATEFAQGTVAVADYCGFVAVLEHHDQCDVILVCSPSPSSTPAHDVRFYCQREVLAGRCLLAAHMQSFEENVKPTARVPELVIPARGDIVFEALRYAYTGVLLFPQRFHKRFGEFLVAVDYLGMCNNAELSVDDVVDQRLWAAPCAELGSIFDALSLRGLLEGMSNEMIRHAFGFKDPEWAENKTVTSPLTCSVGFRTRQALLAKVAELRLRACDGPPPSDPFIVFDKLMGNFEVPTSVDVIDGGLEEGWRFADEDAALVQRRHSF